MAKNTISVLERLKKDSFKKKDEPIQTIKKEYEIIVTEKEEIHSFDKTFDYSIINDIKMREDLMDYEKQLHLAKSSYHSKAGEILLEANEKYANNKNGNFGLWLDHLKVGRKNAERLINRFKFIKNYCTTEDLKLYFESLPLSLTYEVSAPTADKILIEAVLSKEITTRKKYIEIKKSLIEQSKSLNSLIQSKDIVKQFKRLNNNLSYFLEVKLQEAKLDTEKAQRVYSKIEALNEELLNLLEEIKES